MKAVKKPMEHWSTELCKVWGLGDRCAMTSKRPRELIAPLTTCDDFPGPNADVADASGAAGKLKCHPPPHAHTHKLTLSSFLLILPYLLLSIKYSFTGN